MLFTITVALIAYYFGKSGMAIPEFLALMERLLGSERKE